MGRARIRWTTRRSKEEEVVVAKDAMGKVFWFSVSSEAAM